MWLNDFLLAQWLWAMTWGFYHVPFTMIAMFFLAKISLKLTAFQSLLLSMVTNLAAVATYTLIVLGIINFFEGPTVDLSSPHNFCVMPPFQASLLLAMLYSILDLIYMYILTFVFKFSLLRLAVVALVSNAIAALMVYAMQPLL